jgi:hypothetical protein
MQDMLNLTISPTNMFVMLKKRQARQSDWFFRKDSYSLPSCGHQAKIVLHEKVVVYVDKDAETQQESVLKFDNWFQSPVYVKGFRRCKD